MRRLKQRSKRSACGRASGRSKSDCMPKSRGEGVHLSNVQNKFLALPFLLLLLPRRRPRRRRRRRRRCCGCGCGCG